MSATGEQVTPTDGFPPCLFCGTPLQHSFVDLGMHPLCESFVPADRVQEMEPFFPLDVRVCSECFLVQLQEYVSPADIFSHYAYFSSYSDSWLRHAERYTETMIERLTLDTQSFVVELASNDGYLLRNFVARNIPCLGIEPAANVAQVAIERNVPTRVAFFGEATARELVAEGRQADLVAGNNVLAQVPNINDFVAGIKVILKPTGVVTIEFPHLVRLMEENQFDTIYHEHFFYFSFITAEKIFGHHGLRVFDVEELPTHGGSLRIFACHEDDTTRPTTGRATALRARETDYGITRLETYASFEERVKETKRKILDFLIAARRAGKRIAAYGAPGKGNTLLNYCGIGTDFLDYAVDRSDFKQGMFTPGSRIPIYHPDRLRETKPDYVLILPWNLRKEITAAHAYIREWGGQFVVPIPEIVPCD